MPLAKRNNDRINEALDLLQEEAAEIIQIVSKIRRFGSASYHPDDPNKVTNVVHLMHEVGDLELIVNILIDYGYISEATIKDRMKWKQTKLEKYTNLYEKTDDI